MNIKKWIRHHWVVIVIFLLFVVANAAYLHRVPGLMGDEAHEGENVFRLLDTKQITFQGERSYIGPLIDYLRIPFVIVFGFSALALRITMLAFSLLTFALTFSVLKRLFGNTTGILAASIVLFSPIYLGQQRMAWAITLNVFFAVLFLWILQRDFKYKPLVAGLVAGLGVQNHILFLPVALAIGLIKLVSLLPKPKLLLSWWPAIIGFWAGFAAQAVMLTTLKEDQGDPMAVAEFLGDRLIALPKLMPVLLSGSSYIARYTGVEFSVFVSWFISAFIGTCIVLALALSKHRTMVIVWLIGLAIQLGTLLVIIDRFNLRYFVVFVLGVWALAGVGLGEVLSKILRSYYGRWLGLVSAGVLMILSMWLILIPFLRTGGSLDNFSLGNRTDSAAALVDTRSLLQCVRGLGPVTSENVHIYNRLNFLSHKYSDLVVIDPDHIGDIKPRWVVNYRDAENQEPGRCPDLKFFIVKPR